MGKGAQKGSGPKSVVPKSRKEIRKYQRKEKKLKRSMQYQRQTLKLELPSTSTGNFNEARRKSNTLSTPQPWQGRAESRDLEKSKQDKLLSDMQQSRKKQLLVANEEEDRNIRHLEKLLRLNRRKVGNKKQLPKSFADDGLGYLLEVCDADSIKASVQAERALHDSGSEFEEDFACVTGKKTNKERGKKSNSKVFSFDEQMEIGDQYSHCDNDSESDIDCSDEDSSGVQSTVDGGEEDGDIRSSRDDSDNDMASDNSLYEEDSISENKEGETQNFSSCVLKIGEIPDVGEQYNRTYIEGEKQDKAVNQIQKKREKDKINKHFENSEPRESLRPSNLLVQDGYQNDNEGDNESSNEEYKEERIKMNTKTDLERTWEDIYGRTRDKHGVVIDAKPEKYIPPALRAKVQGDEDIKRKENLARLRRQMKGLINRLAENNMASICSQMDELFMKNSRNDMNETLMHLSMDALVSRVLSPERIVMEHMLLIAVLHANVGSEIGAYFLQNIMKTFQEMLDQLIEVENKKIDNVVLMLSHLYNFKVFSALLMYEVLHKIAEKLDEKRIELLLLILRSVGFSLRKDDPLALKNLILRLQTKALEYQSTDISNRVKFMIDILVAIKNNNVSKIPSYNPEHTEHLKKLLRSLIRRGNYVAELKISLDDLLKADERGRWWIVGSAWTGHLPGENPFDKSSFSSSHASVTSGATESSYSSELLALARKQRMNTGTRKDIFCILMTAEDYLDAFEKLLHLNLKNQQRQEIVYVLFDCCLQEKSFNPYYAHLCQKFCDFDRQYQMKIQYCLWDKLKELDKLNNTKLSNMAKLLAHLFLEKGLPISALKVISFAEMDKPCVRLVRQTLLNILLSDDVSKCEAVFLRIAPSSQLYLFREGLRLFVNHFVLRKGSQKALGKKESELLQKRATIADKAMSLADSRMEF